MSIGIKVDDTVKIVSPVFGDMFAGKTGKVIRIHDFPITPIAIVEFEDGMTVKAPLGELLKVTPQETAKETLPKGAKEITITDFDGAIMQTTICIDDPKKAESSISAMIVGRNIEGKLFEHSNSVVMTKDQFVATLWDGCSPANIGESINNAMTSDKCLKVSLSAMIFLRGMIDILFGESENA